MKVNDGLHRSQQPQCQWLSLGTIGRWEALARQRSVSEVARSPEGFLAQYRAAKGRPAALTQAWKDKRDGFVARFMAKAIKNDWSMWGDDGLPTNWHLAMIIWASSPATGNERLRILAGPNSERRS